MKTCDENKAVLMDLVFGELEGEREARLNEHLSFCPDCQSEERRLIELRDGVRGRAPAPGAGLRERIRAALPRRRVRAATILGRPVPAYVALAAGLVGALLVAAFSRQSAPVDAPVREAAPPARTVGGGDRPSFAFAGAYDTRVKDGNQPRSIRDSSSQLRDSI